MQALYAFAQSEDKDMNLSEKALFAGIDKLYESYLKLLAFVLEIGDVSRLQVADAAQKHITANIAFDANPRLMDNAVIEQLVQHTQLANKCKSYKVSWNKDQAVVKQVFAQLRKTEEYIAYIESTDLSYKADMAFMIWFIKKFLADSAPFNQYMEEFNMFWADDANFVHTMVLRTLKLFEEDNSKESLFVLYKDEADDIDFVKQLFRKTIINDEEFEKAIAQKTQNWDVERIALTDIILMKMCLAEVISFSSIPVKVSINEYIDISKEYSTPKSKTFINGVVDKIVADFREQDKIHKVGRGLME